MALVCPVGHPPGTGTRFCRLCGRDYLEVSEVVETLVPVQEPPVEAKAVIPAMPVAPVRPSAPPVASPPVAPPPPPPVAPVPPKPEPPKALEVVAVPAPVAIQVTMPLVPVGKPSPTSTTPVDLGGPVIEGRPDEDSDEADEPKPGKVRRELDRAALLAGVVGGFFGGAVSGAAVTYLLS
jgi:hypothetical protein